MAPPSPCSMVCSDPVVNYIHQLMVLSVGLVLLVFFGLLYAWHVHEAVVGRHVETGESLSKNHAYPVGIAALVLHY